MPLLDRDDLVLVVIDAQPGFLAGEADWRSSSGWLGWPCPARGAGARHGGGAGPERRDGRACRRRLPADTPVFRKPTFGLAGTPEILEAVRATGRGTVVVVGWETDVCVAQSAIGLRGADFACVVVEDVTVSSREMHERGLARLAPEGVARNHAKGVTYEWLRTVADAHAVPADPMLPSPPFRLLMLTHTTRRPCARSPRVRVPATQVRPTRPPRARPLARVRRAPSGFPPPRSVPRRSRTARRRASSPR